MRREAISLGIPILLCDGRTLLCACRSHQDKGWEEAPWTVTAENVAKWASQEWIDLRAENMSVWRERFRKIQEEADYGASDSSSRFDRGMYLWERDGEAHIRIDPGEMVAWVLIHEFRGGRFDAYLTSDSRETTKH